MSLYCDRAGVVFFREARRSDYIFTLSPSLGSKLASSFHVLVFGREEHAS
jgi:hypothetical protein